MSERAIDRVTAALDRIGVRWKPATGGNIQARCPVHNGEGHTSFSARQIDGRAVMLCRADCDKDDLLQALGLRMADLFDEPKGQEYRYVNAAGAHTRSVFRTPDKKFRQSGNTDLRHLYRLPQVLAAVAAGQIVWLVEGEQDVHTLESLGAVATTAPQGSDGISNVDLSPLEGAVVFAIPDRDGPGKKWAGQVRRRLDGFAASVTVMLAAEGKDATDHVLHGYGLDDFVAVDPDPDEGVSTAEDTPERQVVIASASSMRMRAPRWIYAGRMPSNAITLLAGREGIGKSTIAFDIVARITRGELEGRFQGEPRGVGVVASEDSWESVILPRLVAARADLTRVYRVEARTDTGLIETISAPADLPRLAQRCAEHDIAAIVLDPVMSVIHGTLDTHKDREVRQALDPLARFCAENEVAVLGLIHVNKSSTTDPLNSIMASRAFTAVARSVLYCIVDPEAEQEDRYLFGHPKCNLGPRQSTIAYRLAGVTLEIEADDPRDANVHTSRVIWEGEDGRSIREAMEGPPKERPKGELSARILEYLAEQSVAVSVQDIAGKFGDVKPNTLRQTLTRMAKRGDITRLMTGLYVAASTGDNE